MPRESGGARRQLVPWLSCRPRPLSLDALVTSLLVAGPLNPRPPTGRARRAGPAVSQGTRDNEQVRRISRDEEQGSSAKGIRRGAASACALAVLPASSLVPTPGDFSPCRWSLEPTATHGPRSESRPCRVKGQGTTNKSEGLQGTRNKEAVPRESGVARGVSLCLGCLAGFVPCRLDALVTSLLVAGPLNPRPPTGRARRAGPAVSRDKGQRTSQKDFKGRGTRKQWARRSENDPFAARKVGHLRV